MKLVSLQELQAIATAYVNQDYIANPSFTPTINDLTGLINKIAKTIFLDGDYSEEALSFMFGDDLRVGDGIEEYFMNFVSPEAVDYEGTNNDRPSYPTFSTATYSWSLGEKILKTTESYSRIQKSFSNEADYRECVSMIMKRIYDSLTLWLNDTKRQFLGKIAAKLTSVKDDTTFVPHVAYSIGTRLKDSVVVKKIESADFDSEAQAIAAGAIVKLDLASTLAKPTDEATGEAFIISVKEYAEKFMNPQQGYSYNGNIAGKAPSYLLLIKEGVMPNLEVKTRAGAIHTDELAFPENVEIKRIKNFGDNTSVYAMLIDARAAKVHNNVRYVLEHLNADGGFLNHVIHDEETCHYSVNTMAHVWNNA